MSSTYFLEINGVQVPVVPTAAGIDLGRCLKAKPLLDWAAGLDTDLIISRIEVDDADYFGARVGFLKIEAFTTFHGVRVPGICFMRGGAVSILVLLKCEGETWVVCTRQPRVPVGCAALLELPAGMLDDSGAFAGVAAKELKEETGICLREEDLVDLTARALLLDDHGAASGSGRGGDGGGGGGAIDSAAKADPARIQNKIFKSKGLYPSAGGCDEYIRLMFHERNVTRAELDSMRGKATGNLEEGEVIVLDLIPYKSLWRICSDAKALSSMFLYERLLAEGSI